MPQLLSSVVVSTQKEPPPVPHTESLLLGQDWQVEPPSAPARQSWFAAHITPHCPQLFRSVVVSTQVPLHTVRGVAQGPPSLVYVTVYVRHAAATSAKIKHVKRSLTTNKVSRRCLGATGRPRASWPPRKSAFLEDSRWHGSRDGAVMRSYLLLNVMILFGCSSQGLGVQTGAALVTRFKCASCHGADLSGSDSPIGGTLAYAGNLTPDPATGLASWPDDQIITAVRGPDGGADACAAMPRYALTDDEATALVGYLRGLLPVVHDVPAGDCSGPAPDDLDDASVTDVGIIIIPSGP